MVRVGPGVAELAVSDHGQLDPLAEYLRLVVPAVQVTRLPGRAGPGELGVMDVLTIAADSSVLVAVINVLPQFLRSRKPGLSVTATIEGNSKQLVVNADDARDAAAVVREFLDD